MATAQRGQLDGWRKRLRAVRWQLGIGSTVSIGLAWAAVQGLQWDMAWDTLLGFPFWVLLVSLVPLLLSMVFRAARWHVLLVDQPVRGWQTFLTQNTGIGLNNLLPIRMVSEPVQLAIIIRQYGVAGVTAPATLVAGNVLDIIATGILIGTGVVVSPSLQGLTIPLAGALLLLVAGLLVLMVAAKGLNLVPVARRLHVIREAAGAFRSLRREPGRLALSFGFTTVHWLLLGLAGWTVARSLGIELGVLTITALLVASTFFVSAVPSLPAGIGTYEMAMVSSLRVLEVNHATAFAYALIIHFLLFLPSTVIAVVMLFRLGMGQVMRRPREGALEQGSTEALRPPFSHE